MLAPHRVRQTINSLHLDKGRRPIHGVGIGLRSCHYSYILQHRPPVPWLEVLSDNYMVEGGPALDYLDAINALYPVVLHGVGLSIGSTDPLNQDYLSKLKRLAARVNPTWVSDHLCWTSVAGQHFHDLIPLPHTEEAIEHVATRIQQVQAALGVPLLIENVSSYLEYQESDLPEWAFINAVAERADCYILLDINNLYVNAINHQFDPQVYIDSIIPGRVKQFHLAGYTEKPEYLFDQHSENIHPPVWSLYEKALKRFGAVPTLIERDDNIPPFPALLAEAEKAKEILQRVTAKISHLASTTSSQLH